MVTLEQLRARVPLDLRPVAAGPVGRHVVRGVHISELVDPTPYLEGGELLLTTGIPFSQNTSYDDYVRRLAERSVAALGLGLGEGVDEVDQRLARACVLHGVELFVVPPDVPFQRLSQAYWELVSLGERAELASSLRMQTTLADAANTSDAPTAIVQKLAQALGGWVAYESYSESEMFSHPNVPRRLVTALNSQMGRLRSLGPYSSATFPLGDWAAIGHTVMDGGRAVGFLTVATPSPTAHPDRQVLLTAATLLSGVERLRFERRHTAIRTGRAIAELVVAGHTDAATMLASIVSTELPAFVRVIAIRGSGVATASHESLARDVGSLAAVEPDPTLGSQIAHTPFGMSIGDARILLLPAAPGEHAATTKTAAQRPLVSSAVVSLPVPLETVPAVVARLVALVAGSTAGTLLVDHPAALSHRASAWIETLANHPQQNLIPSLRSYLRHRGHWESSARDLGIHRNSLRSRIAAVESILGVDVDNVDIATDLWIALRDRSGPSA